MAGPADRPGANDRDGADGGEVRPRRFVFVSLEYPPAFGGGIGTYVAAMTRVLARQGHRVTVLTVTGEPAPERDILPIGPKGLEVVRLPVPRSRGAEPGVTLRVWQELSDLFAGYLHRLVASEGYSIDAIEFPDYRGEALSFLSETRRGSRPPCIIRLHTPCVVLNRYNRARERHVVLEAFENDALRLADRLVSPSRVLARELEAAVPGLPPIDILPYPADPEFLAIDPETARRTLCPGLGDSGAEEILYVGRLEERKGVEALMHAAPRILAACPGAMLHMVGGDCLRGPDSPSMLEHLLGLLPAAFAERVLFHGRLPREALVERYLRARVCVFPSLFENFPNTCLESMALGRPTVGTDNSGMAEMIEHGVSGVVTVAGDADALAHDVASLYNASPERRAAMGRAARERVGSLYDPERIGREYVRVMTPGPSRDGNAVPGTLPARPVRARPNGSIAVVIPCFNHGEFVRDALESVRDQTVQPDEIVIVDDGSTDTRTRRVLAQIDGKQGVRVVRRENGGLAAARNTGVRATSTEFFVPLDADDRIEPDFIERLHHSLAPRPALGYAYGHARYFGAEEGEWRCLAYDPLQLLVGNLSVATALVRREAFDLVGGYREEMRRGFEDWDFWLGLLSVGYRGVCVPDAVFMYRKHEGGSMLGQTQMSRPEILAEMVARHTSLYQHNHAWALVEKDRMFFDAHMQAWKAEVALGEAHARLAWLQGGPGPHQNGFDPRLRPVVAPRAELDRILNSRLYRAVRGLKSLPPYRAYAAKRYGKGWTDGLDDGPPMERLDRLKASRGYRVISALKRTPAYRMWAGWQYGAGWDGQGTHPSDEPRP